MNNRHKYNVYKRISIIDIIVVIMSLIAFIALIFLLTYYNSKSNLEQKQLVETGSIYQGINTEDSLYEVLEYLVINEVNQAGWIEFYNKGKNAEIDLLNCYITVNGTKKYTFSERDVIKNGDYLCVEGLGQLGTKEHEVIGIFDESGENIKNIMLPYLSRGESYGCKSDGYISYCYLSATKEKTNGVNNVIKKGELTFSVPGGFYDESFLLEITASEGMTVYYTLDSSEPTNKSNIYKEPILIENKSGSQMHYATDEGIEYAYSYHPSSISMGMVVRALAVDSSGLSREMITQSYFVGLKAASDIKNLPVLSITTAPENLFDYFDGIYVSGRSREDALVRGEEGVAANYLNGWEKEAHVEYFEKIKDKTYEGNMSISIIKDISVALPQKSLLLKVSEGDFTGSGLMNYYNESSKQLVVQTNRKDNIYKIREYLAGRLLADTTVGAPDIMPCIVFINGEYWGGYMLRGEFDEKYIEKRYNVKKEDVLIAKNNKIINNSDYQKELDEFYYFINNNDLAIDENYDWVKDHLDIQNYLEYFCANMYLANVEYGQNNLVMWRTINNSGTGYEDGKWRFLLPDLDNTMKNGEAGKVATSSVNTFLQRGVTNDLLFQSLLKNNEFKYRLLSVMTEMAEEIFTEERVNSSISEISTQFKKMVVMSYKRFIGNQGDSFYTKEVDKIKSFFEQRERYILRYTKEVISQGGNSDFYDDELFE